MSDKIGLKDGRTLLKTAASTIRTLTAEKAELTTKVAQYEENERIVKVAQEMEEKGLGNDLDFEAKVAHLKERAKTGNLAVTEEAVKLAGPQGNYFGDIHDDSPIGGGGSSEETLMTFILTGEDTRQ